MSRSDHTCVTRVTSDLKSGSELIHLLLTSTLNIIAEGCFKEVVMERVPSFYLCVGFTRLDHRWHDREE